MQREKAILARFSPPEVSVKDPDDLKPVGSGTALGEIDYINEVVGKLNSTDEALAKLHSLCYGKMGQKSVRKRNLRLFNGFASDADIEQKVSISWA